MKSFPVILVAVVVTVASLVGVLDLSAFANQGEKIADVKDSTETLWQFLAKLPFTFESQITYAIILFGGVGMMGNYTIKWLRRDIAGSLFRYLFSDNIRGTLLSFFATVGVGVTAISSGIFETAGGEFVGWTNVMWVSLTNGFMWDAALNKGSRAEWSNVERAEKVGGGDAPPRLGSEPQEVQINKP